jgi:xylulose-5-phosphate/fructose-6-phosphate phosphoketolase
VVRSAEDYALGPGYGAVVQLLHLNGQKIANPTILARLSDGEVLSGFVGYGLADLVDGGRPETMQAVFLKTLLTCRRSAIGSY